MDFIIMISFITFKTPMSTNYTNLVKALLFLTP